MIQKLENDSAVCFIFEVKCNKYEHYFLLIFFLICTSINVILQTNNINKNNIAISWLYLNEGQGEY